jgi:DNA polymerase (family 10)
LSGVTNAEIAGAFDELAVLYELDGAVRYRVLAYSNAARAIRESPVSVAELARAGKATSIAGVGKTLEQKIVTLLDTGDIPSAVRLREKFPPTLIEVTRVPHLGAKTARRLYDELDISSVEDLRAAAEAQRIRELKGLGPKVEENILAALEQFADPESLVGRLLLSKVRPVAEELAAALRSHPAAIEVEVAGSVRRWAETCKDIDLIATAEEPEQLSRHLAGHPLIAAAGTPGPNGLHAQTHNGVSVDLRIVAPEAFGNLLQHFTGSAAHNIALREDAVARGFSVSEHGITETETGQVTLCGSEAEVYERLGYAYIEPELREGRGELAAARERSLPDLVEIADIRGELHCHTTLSDGRNTLEEMAAAGRARGYSYMAITDHSASHGFGDHVTEQRLWKRIGEIREWNEGKRGFRLLAGSEVNIGTDGSLDYPDDLLAALDWVIASIHTSFSEDEKEMTGRLLAAIENPLVDCIGHPTGRLLLRRPPYPIDIEAIAEAAARTGTMLEINGNPNRRDLSEQHARLAAEAEATIVLNTDAHGTDTLDNVAYAVATARRAWLGPEQIANTRGWREFKAMRKRARG